MMRIDTIQTYVMAHRATPNELLRSWLRSYSPNWKRGSQVGFRVDLARNQTCNQFLRDDVPRGKTDLLLLDADMVPVIETRGILSQPGELVFCCYAGHHGTHGHRSTPGAACVRVSAELLAKMTRPFFHVPVNETCDELLGCECDHFHAAAVAAGAKAIRVGTIGHQQGGSDGVILFPNDGNKTGYSFCWPEDLPYSSSPSRSS